MNKYLLLLPFALSVFVTTHATSIGYSLSKEVSSFHLKQEKHTEVENQNILYRTTNGLRRIGRHQDWKSLDDAQELCFATARNEIEEAQVILRSERFESTIKGIRFTDLKCGNEIIPASCLDYSFALYEHTTRVDNKGHEGFAASGTEIYPKNEIPDPLSNARRIDIPQGVNQPVYISLKTAKNVQPGKYKGKATIETSLGNLNVPITVTVYAAIVPDVEKSRFTCYNWISDMCQGYTPDWNVFDTYYHVQCVNNERTDFTSDFYSIINTWGKLMHTQRQNAVYIHTQAYLGAANTTIKDGIFDFDWTLFDKYVDFWLRSGMTRIIGIHYGYHENDMILEDDGTGQTTFAWKGYSKSIGLDMDKDTWYRQFLTALAQHIEAFDLSPYSQFKGTNKKCLFDIWGQQLYDEPTNAPLWTFYAQLTQRYFVNKEGKSVPMFDADMTGATVNKPYTDYVGIQVPQLIYVPGNEKTYQDLQSAGVPFWMYVCVSPHKPWLNRFLLQPDTTYPMLFWYAAKVNATGYLHWALNVWNCGWFWDGDTYITYPDVPNKSIMNSIRFNGQRNGIEDWELFQMAKKVNPEKAARILNLAIVHPNGDYVTKVEDFLLLRKSLLELASGNTEVELPQIVPGGKELAPSAPYGAYYVDNRNTNIRYHDMENYELGSPSEGYLQSVHYQNYRGPVGSDGGWAEYDFNGTGIEIMSEQRSNKGNMRVELYRMNNGKPQLIDKQLIKDCWALAVKPFYIAYKKTGLPQGDYRIRMTHVRTFIEGTDFSQMVLDAFIVHTLQKDGSSLVSRMTVIPDSNGSVTLECNKEQVISGNSIRKGKTLTIHLFPNKGYKAVGINVNGFPMEVKDSIATITKVDKDMIIVPLFEKQ